MLVIPKGIAIKVRYWPDGVWVFEEDYKPSDYSYKSDDCTVVDIILGEVGENISDEELHYIIDKIIAFQLSVFKVPYVSVH